MSGVATCLHCGGECRLTNGAEVYPWREDLADRKIWKCDPCNATVGCHPKSTRPLGYAADKATRRARMILHDQKLDPLWLDEADRKTARRQVYKFLAAALGIHRNECHTGQFDIDRCRAAWRALSGQTPESIRAWNEARASAAKESEIDRKTRRRSVRRRQASRGTHPLIAGPQFRPAKASLEEVPW